jgi:hypothetical protein
MVSAAESHPNPEPGHSTNPKRPPEMIAEESLTRDDTIAAPSEALETRVATPSESRSLSTMIPPATARRVSMGPGGRTNRTTPSDFSDQSWLWKYV